MNKQVIACWKLEHLQLAIYCQPGHDSTLGYCYFAVAEALRFLKTYNNVPRQEYIDTICSAQLYEAFIRG